MTPQPITSLDIMFWMSFCALLTCSIASILSGVAWMRYEEEQSYLDAKWPTDGITREPRQRGK